MVLIYIYIYINFNIVPGFVTRNISDSELTGRQPPPNPPRHTTTSYASKSYEIFRDNIFVLKANVCQNADN